MRPKHSIVCEPPQVAQCVIDPTIPPNPMLPGNNTTCTCIGALPPAPVMVCQVSVMYPANDPANPSMLPMGPWCDAAGMELAIAVILARLLGGH